MLKRVYRASRPAIAETIRTGRTIPGTFLYAKISRSQAGKPAFAVIVPKKAEKTSVGRHLVKRRISAAIERLLFRRDPSFRPTIVFFAKKADRPVPRGAYAGEVEKILAVSGFFGRRPPVRSL